MGHRNSFMTSRRAIAFAAATRLLVGFVAPDAHAQSPAKKKVEAARQLKVLQASDTQLADAVRALDAQVKATDAQRHSARQSVKAAKTALGLAQVRVGRAEAAMAHLRGALVERAIEAYKRPQRFGAQPGDGAGLGEMSRRQALLRHVTKTDEDILDQVRATREDLVRQRAAAERARAVAAARQEVVEQRLRSLLRDRDTKGRLSAALEKRIREVQAEITAIAGDNRAVTQILRQSGSTARGKTSRLGLQWPVRGRLTSSYGRRWGRLHAGIDVAAPRGTVIRAAKAGVVVFAGRMGGYGNCVIVDHGGGLSTLYGHQSRLGSRRGQRVSPGQTIGYVGSTGRSTGNHLHFETRVNGRPQNPRTYLP